MDMFDQIKRLRSSTLVKERSFGDISSFNFTRKAFFDAKWNELTTKARGLFIVVIFSHALEIIRNGTSREMLFRS